MCGLRQAIKCCIKSSLQRAPSSCTSDILEQSWKVWWATAVAMKMPHHLLYSRLRALEQSA